MEQQLQTLTSMSSTRSLSLANSCESWSSVNEVGTAAPPGCADIRPACIPRTLSL